MTEEQIIDAIKRPSIDELGDFEMEDEYESDNEQGVNAEGRPIQAEE